MSTRAKSLATALVSVVVNAFVPAAAQTVQPGQGTSPSRVSPEEILADHTKDDKGGSAETGRPLFEQRCGICHRFGGIGKDVGPDLTTITSRFKKKDILESILWPSRVISDQYQAEIFELNDGTIVTGVIVRETANAVLVRPPATPDKPVAVAKAQIANRALSTVSLMPPGLLDNLTTKEIADLLAFVMAPPPDK